MRATHVFRHSLRFLSGPVLGPASRGDNKLVGWWCACMCYACVYVVLVLSSLLSPVSPRLVLASSVGDKDWRGTLEFARVLHVINVQPVDTIVQQLPPDIIASNDGPPRHIPDPYFDSPGVSIIDEGRNDIALFIADSC